MTLKKLLYGLLAIFCAWLGYYQLDRHWHQSAQIQPDNEKPIFIGNKISNTTFDLDGLRSYQIDSEHLEYFENAGYTDFVKPVLWVFQDGENTEWRISANSAVLNKKNELNLTGNVRMFNLLPNSDIKVIKTNNLHLNIETQAFHTQDHVTITGPAFINEGDGMAGNMKQKVAKLLKNVKSRYEPAKN